MKPPMPGNRPRVVAFTPSKRIHSTPHQTNALERGVCVRLHTPYDAQQVIAEARKL